MSLIQPRRVLPDWQGRVSGSSRTDFPTKASLIRPLIPQENGGNFYDMRVRIWHKNYAVPACTFPVPPLPPSPLQGYHITSKWIGFERINRPRYLSLNITGKPLELPLCFV